MGLRSWLFGKEDKPPEPLVLGAELSCPYGAENSYLIVQTKDINISNLPGACVLDRKEYENIMPFGQCIMGAPCATVMELEKQWENEEPQKTLANGEEIITTKSTLMCKTFGVAIEAVTSGQDGVEAARMAEEFAFLQNMEEKYPGLFEVLRNPWGSVYLTEGMYKLALQFLEDYVEKNGEMQIQVLYSEPSLQTDMVKAAIGHLLAFCNEENEGDLINLLYVRGSTSGMYEVPGWQPDLLNEAMIELLRKDCEDTAERIETNAYYRWQEKNKQHIRWYAEKGMELAYASLILWDMTAEQTRASRQMEEVKKYAEKVNEVEKEAGQVEGGSSTVNGFDTTINSGKQGKHIIGNNNFIEGRSIFNGTVDDAQRLVDNFAGTGEWIGANKERVNFGEIIGQYVNPVTNEAVDTTVGIIHYSQTGTHIVPAQPVH